MPASALPIALLLLLGVVIATANPALGENYRWTGNGPVPKAFNNPQNWDLAGVPGTADRSIFGISDTVLFTTSVTNDDSVISGSNFAGGIALTMNQSGEQTWNLKSWRIEERGAVTMNGPDVNVVANITVWNAGTLTIAGGSRVTAAGISTSPIPTNHFTGSGQVNINSGGALRLTQALELGAGSPVKNSHGTLNVNGGVGTFQGGVLLAESGTAATTGRISITNGGVVHQTGSALRVATQNNINSSVATVTISGAGSAYHHSNSAIVIGSSTAGKGTLSISGGGLLQSSSLLTINPLGTTIVNGGSLSMNQSIIVDGGSLIFGNGTISLAPGFLINILNGGTFASASDYTVSPGTRFRVSAGLATLNGGMNVAMNSSGSITVAAGGVLDANNPSVWASGSAGAATVLLSGVTNINSGLTIGVNGAAANVTVNAGTFTVRGAPGLTIGDATGDAPVDVLVTGASANLNVGSLSTTRINPRGTIQLLSGGRFSTSGPLEIDGGTFDGSAGVYNVGRISVSNNGLFLGTNHSGSIQLASGGKILLTGALSPGAGLLSVGGTDTLLQSNSASLFRTNMLIGDGGAGSFGSVTLLTFNPPNIPGATLRVEDGGTLRVATAFEIEPKSTLVVFTGGSATLSGTLVSNGGTVSVSGGSLSVEGTTTNNAAILINSSSGAVASFADVGGTGSFSVSGTSAVTFNHLRQPSVSVLSGARLMTRPSGGATGGVSRIDSLELTSPELGTAWDLTDNALFIDYAAGGHSPLSKVRGLLGLGYAGGAWTGNGITTSKGSSTHALGYSEAASLFGTFPATYMGQTIDDTAVLIVFTRYGDANLDGVVNLSDFNRLAANFGSTNAVWAMGDFNYDGVVNLQDFNRLAANFGLQAGPEGPTPDDWSNLASAIPEPTSMSILIGTLALAQRRRGGFSRHVQAPAPRPRR